MANNAGRAPDYRDRGYGQRKQSDIPKAEREEMERRRQERVSLARATVAPILRRSPSTRYDELKTFIGQWVGDRFKIAEALKEIHDQKLYKHEYSSFADFCHDEYGINRSSAYRLMDFVEMKALTETSQSGTSIFNETQAAELAKAPSEQRVKVLQETAASGPVTARRIAENAAKRKPLPKVIDVEPEPVTHSVRHCSTCTCE